MEGAQQRKRIQRDEALPIVSNNPTFMCWEQLDDGATIKYGSRTYTKGRRGQEEMLMGHIKRTHESNAKRPPKGQGVLAAATEEGGKRGTKRRAAALSEALSPAAVVVNTPLNYSDDDEICAWIYKSSHMARLSTSLPHLWDN